MSGHQHTVCGKPETIVGTIMCGWGVSQRYVRLGFACVIIGDRNMPWELLLDDVWQWREGGC